MKLVLSQDITERERNDAMRRDFVANVSHEIRTPLTVLSGFLETLSNLPLTEVERRRVLELMSQQTTRMQTLVGDLLTLAQLEGSPRPAADRWVAVQTICSRRSRPTREALSAGRHALALRDAGDGAEIAGAETELLSAMANLVNNAVRYTPDGRQRSTSRWRVRADGAGELAVRDTGLGIAREHLPRLTERFYRVDGSRSRETGGTGLGPVDRQARGAAPRRRARDRQRAGQGLELPAGLPGGARAHASSRRRTDAALARDRRSAPPLSAAVSASPLRR